MNAKHDVLNVPLFNQYKNYIIQTIYLILKMTLK